MNTPTTDPVCGMSIEASTAAASTTYQGVTYYFCSPTCRATFETAPDRYASTAR